MSEQLRDKDQLAFLKWFRRPNVDPSPRLDKVWHAAFAHVRKEEVEPLRRSIEGFIAKEGNRLIRWNDDGTYTIQRGAK